MRLFFTKMVMPHSVLEERIAMILIQMFKADYPRILPITMVMGSEMYLAHNKRVISQKDMFRTMKIVMTRATMFILTHLELVKA